MRTLSRLQLGLEDLYRLSTGLDIHDFLVGDEIRDAVSPARRPREQLLVCEDGEEMSVALYLDRSVLDSLAAYRELHDRNLGDFLLALEGVSHFIYAITCAKADRPVSQLELELQGEVDKYVTCLLAMAPETGISSALRRRLFDAEYEPDLDDDEQSRYRAANDNAQRYAAWLEETFVVPRRIPEMLGELRRFYRQGLAAKLSTIARAA